jgi:lincosamide nucleotidyltransferase A/C/D/E
MEAAEVRRLVEALDAASVRVWLDGGWGVDALLEEETREHDDLDLVVALEQGDSLAAILRSLGYEHVAGSAPTSFVLVDRAGHQVDVHPVTFDPPRGGGVYLMEDGREWMYPMEGFSGTGRVAGHEVRCLSPKVQVLVHTGYELTAKDYRELELLRERFGVEIPGG